MMEPNTPTADEIEYCPKHPHKEALLHCNRCGRLMCTKCAVRTPTGYRCVDCVRGQQQVFNTAKPIDFVLGPLAAGILSAIGGLIVSNLWIYFVIFGAPIAGGIIAEAVRRVVGRRRSKTLFQTVSAGVFLGGILPILVPLAGFLMLSAAGQGGPGIGGFLAGYGFNLLTYGLYAVLASGTTYYRLSGLQL